MTFSEQGENLNVIQEHTSSINQQLNFYDLSLPQLTDYLKKSGHQGFRAQQLYRWVYGQGITDTALMTNLSRDFKADIPKLLKFEIPKMIESHHSVDGTKKFLVQLATGQKVETVLIPSDDRITICISSEVGCNMACKFCFTGKQKLLKRLTPAEIVGQFLIGKELLAKEDKRITNIVFMGMGEPLDNCDAVFTSIDIFNESWGLNLSRKKITVSTSGLVDKIPLVSQAKVRLAVSLNGVDNNIRTRIMPINAKWPLEKLLEACRQHYRVTRDKITMEYVLLKGLTDSLDDAKRLAAIARTVPCKVNIIPFNEHPGSGFERPSESTIRAFHQALMNMDIHVLRRKTMGRDIYAACGQLVTKDTVTRPKELVS
jgi:23S rRNA (adenine2503-C2)-methyltransferase